MKTLTTRYHEKNLDWIEEAIMNHWTPSWKTQIIECHNDQWIFFMRHKESLSSHEPKYKLEI